MRGFKGCHGFIESKIIKIRASFTQDNNPLDYYTYYKKYYAIQLLAVCASN